MSGAGVRARCAAVLCAALTMAGGALLATGQAAAYDGRAAYYGGRPGYVVAESRWGNGTVTGAVRPGRAGWQVQLPRGTWVDCGRSCSETLRRQTVDFWQSMGPQSPDQGPGYLRWQFRY